MTKMIRVLVVDDHVVVRQGIHALLATETDIEVVGEAENGREAVAEAEGLQPDVILMDLVMPEMDGIEAIGRITARQIEAARRAITRKVKRGGKLWIRVFPDKPVSKKPLEVRMGKGKGNVEYWVALIQPGKMLYEIEGVSEELARDAFRLAAAKLPVQTTFDKRQIL